MKRSRTSRRGGARRPAQKQKAARNSSRAIRTSNPRDIKRPQQLTSGTETSSLNPHAKFDAEPAAAVQRMDSGDLQSVPAVEDSTLESTAELANAGQDFEAERVEAPEDSAKNEGKPQGPHELPIITVPKFKNRTRL